jgi:hypothetical protein
MGNLQILLSTRCCTSYEENEQDNIPIIEQLPSNLSYRNLKSVESFVTVVAPPSN